MKVLCKKILTLNGEELEYHPEVTIGSTYDVVTITASPEGTPVLRIAANSGQPSLWPARMFSVNVPVINDNWRIAASADGTICLGPPQFCVKGFWEDYFDDDPAALRAYQEEFLEYRD